MADHCEICPALRAENAMLQRHIVELRTRLGELVGGIRSIVALIRRETEQQPTMPRQKLIPTITERLNDLAGR